MIVIELILGDICKFRERAREIEAIYRGRRTVTRPLKSIDAQEWICNIVVIANSCVAATLLVAWRIRSRTFTIDIVATVTVVETASDIGDVYNIVFEELMLNTCRVVPEARNSEIGRASCRERVSPYV